LRNLILSSGNLTKSDQEVSDLLLETHFLGCESIQTDTVEAESRNSTALIEDWDEAAKIVTEDKVRWAVEGFGSFKTAGIDGIFLLS
jgi:hypothetical protein